jgi:hypothetical protein
MRPGRKLLVILVLAASFASLNAEDVCVEGTGTTQAEAQSVAVENLNRYVNGELIISKRISTLSHLETQQSVDSRSTYGETTSASASGYLLGVEYRNEVQLPDGRYQVTAVIPERNTDLYVEKLKNSASAINKINLDDLSDQKSRILSIWAMLIEFEGYSRILFMMGHGDQIPKLKDGITANALYIRYQTILVKEQNELQLRTLRTENEEDRKELLEEIDRKNAEIRLLEDAFRESNEAAQENSSRLLAERLDAAEKLKAEMGDNLEEYEEKSLWQRLSELYEWRANFYSACFDYTNITADTIRNIESEIEAQKKELNERPFRYVELNSDGTPSQRVLNARAEELQDILFEGELWKAAELKLIRSKMLPLIQERHEMYVESMERLASEERYALPVEGSSCTVTSYYDAMDYAWRINFSIETDDAPLEANPVLSYQALTGKEPAVPPVKGESSENYNNFSNEVEYLDKTLRDFFKYYALELRFHILPIPSEYDMGFKGISFTDLELVATIPGNTAEAYLFSTPVIPDRLENIIFLDVSETLL